MRVIQGIEAVTFDFFNTLVSHCRSDGGRGTVLTAIRSLDGVLPVLGVSQS